MTPDRFDEEVRRLVPPVEVSEARATRVIDSVLRRVAEPRREPASQRQVGWLLAIAPVMRFAAPMVAAAMLALVVGRHIAPAGATLGLSDVLVSSTVIPAGY